MFWLVCLLVLLGILSDVLSGAWTHAITGRKPKSAFLTSAAIDILNYGVIAKTVIDRNLIIIAAWIFGRAVGSAIAASLKRKIK